MTCNFMYRSEVLHMTESNDESTHIIIDHSHHTQKRNA
jgi:hypothetical protein